MKIIYQRLWPELMPYKWRLVGVLILGTIVSGLKAASPELFRQLEGAWRESDKDLAILLPILIAVTWSASGIARYYHLYWTKFIADQVAMKLRRSLMNKYLNLNLEFFHNFVRGSGGLISRMVSDIHVIQEGIREVSNVLREPFMVIIITSYLFYLDWKLAVLMLITLPINTWIIQKLAHRLRKYGHKNQEAMEDLTKTLKESLDGTRIIQSYNLSGELYNRFNNQADYYLKTRKKIISKEELSGPITEGLTSVSLAIVFIYIGTQILNKNMTIGDFLAFFLAVALLSDAIKKIQYAYIKLQQAVVALNRMSDILNVSDKITNREKAKTFPADWKQIEFRNVSFSFGNELVLKNINLTIHRGEVIALIGPSGSGKSTLVNLLERFFDPTEGQILIGGVDIKDMSVYDLRYHIALVSQDIFLFNDSVEANIHMGNTNKPTTRIQEAAKMANAHNFIANTHEGYKAQMGDQGVLFSGGEKQRISIARAIFKNAPILILDEATSSLDSESETAVQKGLDQLIKDRTALVIAHRLSTISEADRILVLKDGQIIEQGSHKDLLKNKQGEYCRFYQLQTLN